MDGRWGLTVPVSGLPLIDQCMLLPDLAGYTDVWTSEVAGNIATNPQYETRLRSAVAECKSVGAVQTVGDGAPLLASLAYRYLTLTRAEQRTLAQSFDPLHAVVKLL